jgi:putative tryptophan/tyrosine transport system substrate-binding protein
MRRREVVAGLGLAAAWPLTARAQQPGTLPVIGVLGSASPDQWADRLRAFREGLVEAGYVERKNVALEYRWADGRNDRLLALAAELVRRPVAVIVVLGSTPSAIAAKAATTTVPVVFRVAVDPVELGLVPSLNRPGGNLTGVSTLGAKVGAKQLELLRAVVPAAGSFGLLVNPSNPVLAEPQTRDLAAATGALGLRLDVVAASTDRELEAAFATLREKRTGALVIGADAFFNSRNEHIAALAAASTVPAISPYREFAAAGGPMSYGGSIAEASRQAGVYTGRILNGEKPADLPVQQVSRLELVINAKTANAFALSLPPTLIALADEVIE